MPMIDDVFSLILLSMLAVVQSATDGDEINAWIFLRPLITSAVVTGLGWLAFKLVDAKAVAFQRAVSSGPPLLRKLVFDRAEEMLLLVLLVSLALS